MSTINQAIQEAIRANLPGQVADELQSFIAKAKETESELARTKSELNDVRIRLKDKELTLSQHADVALRERAADERAAKLQAAELELMKKEARIDATVAVAELNGVRTSMAAFLKNTVIRRNVIGGESVWVPQPINGGYQPAPQQMQNQSSETTTEEEE